MRKQSKPPDFFDATYFDRALDVSQPRKSNYALYTDRTADFAARAAWVDQAHNFVGSWLGNTWPFKVLDVGCAKGFLCRDLRALDFLACGLDCSAYAVHEGKKLGIDGLVVGSCLAMPFGDGAFDLAVSWDVLEHVDDPETAVREGARVARYFYHYVNTGEDPGTHFQGDESHCDPHPQAWWDELFERHGRPTTVAGKVVYQTWRK